MKYIGITQNAIGRITNDENCGLTTKGLKSCLGIVLYGTKQTSLIHHDGTSSWEAIQAEFDTIRPTEWEIWYNGGRRDAKVHADLLATEIIKEFITTLAPTIHQVTYSPNNLLGDNRDNGAQIFVTRATDYSEEPSEEPEIEYPGNFELRNAINLLNHLFGGKNFDVQYDGSVFTEITTLINQNYLQEESLLDIYNLAMEQYNLSELTESQKANIIDKWEQLAKEYKDLRAEYEAEEIQGNPDEFITNITVDADQDDREVSGVGSDEDDTNV